MTNAAPSKSVQLAKATAGALLDAFSCVAGMVQRRGDKPILGNVLIEGSSSKLTLTTTDGESRMSASYDLGYLAAPSATTVDTRTILALLRLLPSDKEVSLRLEGDWLMVQSAGSKYRLRTLSAVDFPRCMEPVEDGGQVVMPQGALKTMLDKSLGCMAANDVRAFFVGACLEVSGGEMAVVASTGNSLVVSTYALTSDKGNHRETIPRKIVAELMRLLGEGDDPITIQFGKGRVSFKWADAELVTPTLSGFPKWQRVLPAPDLARCKLSLSRNSLLQALQACASVVEAKTTPMVLLSAGPQGLLLTTDGNSSEGCEIAVDASVAGEAIHYGCNIDLLRDGLLSLSGDSLRMELRDSSSAARITTAEDAQTQFVLMPVRIKALEKTAAPVPA